MPDTPQDQPNLTVQATEESVDVDALLRSLRRKEGTWVEWGQICQQLQKAGLNTQKIFEETGFEPIQQNQIIVAAQVYGSLLSQEVSEPVRSHFEQRGSDTLYEFRILTQAERAAAAAFVIEKGLDSEGAHEVAKYMKAFSRLGNPPEGFSQHPGDAMAYHFWKSARQQNDLQERSRLIAQGLRFAHSSTARQKIEQLLTDFSVVSARPAPRLPVYRLDSSDQMPRILPVVGKFPLTSADLQAVPLVEETGPFRLVQFSGTGAWVPIPGWQVILNAEDPVVVLCSSDQLPSPLPGKIEEVLVVVDRAQRQWDDQSYFLTEQAEQLHLQWLEEAPSQPLLGKVILIMRPKQILDEDHTKDMWQLEE